MSEEDHSQQPPPVNRIKAYLDKPKPSKSESAKPNPKPEEHRVGLEEAQAILEMFKAPRGAPSNQENPWAGSPIGEILEAYKDLWLKGGDSDQVKYPPELVEKQLGVLERYLKDYLSEAKEAPEIRHALAMALASIDHIEGIFKQKDLPGLYEKVEGLVEKIERLPRNYIDQYDYFGAADIERKFSDDFPAMNSEGEVFGNAIELLKSEYSALVSGEDYITGPFNDTLDELHQATTNFIVATKNCSTNSASFATKPLRIVENTIKKFEAYDKFLHATQIELADIRESWEVREPDSIAIDKLDELQTAVNEARNLVIPELKLLRERRDALKSSPGKSWGIGGDPFIN